LIYLDPSAILIPVSLSEVISYPHIKFALAYLDPLAILILDFVQPTQVHRPFNINLQSAHPDPSAILILSSGQPMQVHQPF